MKTLKAERSSVSIQEEPHMIFYNSATIISRGT